VLEGASPAPSATRAGALDWAGYLSNELGEDARALLEDAVACAREADAAGALALALSHLPVVLADSDERIAVLEDALSIAEQAGDPVVLGTALNNLGVWSAERGDTRRARELFEESYRVRAEIGDLARMALSLGNLADAAFGAGDLIRSRDYATQALELAREVGVRREASGALDQLGWIALADGRFAEARELFKEALALELEIASLPQARFTLYGLAAVAAASGDARVTARLAAAAAEPNVHGGTFLGSAAEAVFERHIAAARAQTDPAEWDEAWVAGGALTIEQAAAEVLGHDLACLIPRQFDRHTLVLLVRRHLRAHPPLREEVGAEGSASLAEQARCDVLFTSAPKTA
jgi:tetratricopeptide (TPR) repeat protein